MDGQRFDRMSRGLAHGLTRRAALRSAGAGGLAAVAAASLRRAGAQDATACEVPLELAVRQGPNAGVAWRGTLRLSQDGDGALSGVYVARRDEAGSEMATATPEGDPTEGTIELPVVGQATGRAINLMITVADGQYVFGVGTLENPLDQCAGEMGGPFVGPEAGDTGDWAPCNFARCRAAGGTANFCSGTGLAHFCGYVQATGG
jgi:hypothetical protein